MSSIQSHQACSVTTVVHPQPSLRIAASIATLFRSSQSDSSDTLTESAFNNLQHTVMTMRRDECCSCQKNPNPKPDCFRSIVVRCLQCTATCVHPKMSSSCSLPTWTHCCRTHCCHWSLTQLSTRRCVTGAIAYRYAPPKRRMHSAMVRRFDYKNVLAVARVCNCMQSFANSDCVYSLISMLVLLYL